jgi:ATP-dependent Lon protease
MRGGIKTVLIPEQNVKDLAEIPANVKNALEIVSVRWIDKVLDVALERKPVPIAEEETSTETATASTEKQVEPRVVKH